MPRTRSTGLALAVVAALGLAACSSNSTGAEDTTPASSGGSAAAYAPPPCRTKRPEPPKVVPVDGVPHDFTMTSFDGTRIRFHWYPLDHEAPTVLMGPGWGSAGATESSGTGLFGDAPIGVLHEQGYHVLTWDPRGFGQSTGAIEVDSAAAEGRDVRRLLDWIAAQPDVQLDRRSDPRVGMVGGSYGGGIQLVTAATDCRVDAIVPTIAWHSLATSLHKADTVKLGWSGILYSAAASRNLDPHITSAYESGKATGVISDEDAAWFRSRGPGALVARITAPTLLIQGTVDTLFTLDEAVTNYGILRAHGIPTAMLWYCGGHGTCRTDAGDAARPQAATNAWLQRWLKRDTSVTTGPRIDVIDQHGTRFTAPDWPLALGTPLVASGTGTLDLTEQSGSAPITASGNGPIDGVAAAITPSRATGAVEVKLTATRPVTSIGAPRLTLRYSGTTPAGERPTRVFAQLIDETTGFALGNQVTPVEVTLDGKPHTTTVPLEMISHTIAKGETVTLQLIATTPAYAPPRLGGHVDFQRIRIALPLATGLTRAG